MTKNAAIPFQTGTSIQEPAAFIGRGAIIRRLVDAMRTSQSISLYGERRTGKTSLLCYLAHKDNPARLPNGIVPVYFDFQQAGSIDNDTLWLSIVKKMEDQLRRWLPDEQEMIDAFCQDFNEFRIDPALPVRGLDEALSNLQKHRPDIKVVLLLDEFERMAAEQDRSYDTLAFYSELRSLSIYQNISYVTATRSTLKHLGDEVEKKTPKKLSSPFFNIFLPIWLTPLEESEALLLLYTYWERVGYPMETAEKVQSRLHEIRRITGFHPYFLQLFLFHLCERMEKAGWPNSPAWEETVQAFERDASDHFGYYWDVSDPNEQQALLTLAEGKTEEAHKPQIKPALASLQHRCLAEYRADKDGWLLFSSSFAKWLKSQKIPATQLDYLRQLVELLSKLPRLSLRDGREAWLISSLPEVVYSNLQPRSPNTRDDLTFIFNSLFPIQLANGKWAILESIDSILPDMMALADGPRLKQLRQQIESSLKQIALPTDSVPVKTSQVKNAAIPVEVPVQTEEILSDERLRWLRQLHFEIDPFANLSGAQDPNFEKYFYRIPHFLQIFGGPNNLSPAFVFAAEGGGKSTLRNAIARMCAGSILPVMYRFLDSLAPESQKRQVQRSDHVRLLIRECLETLAITFRDRSPDFSKERDREDIPFLRTFIWKYAQEFHPALLHMRSLRKILQPGNEDTPLPEDERELLGSLCSAICDVFQYKAVYFLVDPEPIEPPVTPETQWNLLKPLLESARFFDLEVFHTTFKFFLDESLLDWVVALPWVNRSQDSLVYRLVWTKESLGALLKERLKMSSKPRGSIISLGQISESTDLDARVIDLSGNSPRRLVSICNRLFLAHLSSGKPGKSIYVTEEDIKAVFLEMRPPMQLDVTRILESMQGIDANTLQQIIAQGENQFVEFKATLRYNVFTKNKDTKMEQVVAQEMCAFANTHGGIIVIGVGDKGEPLGLDNDYSTLGEQRRNDDGYRLAITDVVANYLDRPLDDVRVLFEMYAQKKVCIVVVRKNRQPSYCILEGRAEFFVRVENSARRQDVRQAVQYIREHFEAY